MYAGGKYDPTGENYEFSLGLNGLGSCATQYASRYMDVTVCRDGNEYKLHFQRGEIVGQMEVTPLTRKKTGTTIRWLPDLEVFTDIDIPLDYYQDVMKRQAVVNAGVTFRLRDEVSPGRFETQDFLYENGIRDYLAELAGHDAGRQQHAVQPEGLLQQEHQPDAAQRDDGKTQGDGDVVICVLPDGAQVGFREIVAADDHGNGHVQGAEIVDGLQDDRWQLDGAHKDHDAGQHGKDAGVQQQLFERDLPAVAAHEHEAEGPRHEVIHADPRCPVEHAVRAEQDLLQRQAHVAAIGKHGAVAQNAAGRLLTAADADIGKRGIQRVRCKGQQKEK